MSGLAGGGMSLVALVDTAGERVLVESAAPWVAALIREGADGVLREPDPGETVHIRVERDYRPFDVTGWDPLTRGAWVLDGKVVIENTCSSGFDVLVRCSGELASFTFRWGPPMRDRLGSRALPARFRLLVRAVLLQYPAIWWAGTRGRAPLHAIAYTHRGVTPLLAGPGGVGKSTLLARE